jgi:indole-3-glycerol phosphate synthase
VPRRSLATLGEVADHLAEILARKRASRGPGRRAAELEAAAARAPAPRGFRRALALRSGRLRAGTAASGEVGLVAELKRRSPSKGDLDPWLDPVATARAYEAGGAAALSVLTEEEFFAGSPADLVAAREATGLPVLRKDFVLDELDVLEARAMGADAVLLIVRALAAGPLAACRRLAADLGMDALVEVHDEPEVARALEAGADLVGVNRRDLRSFGVDPERAVRLVGALPADVVRVAESGVTDAGDVKTLAAAGFDAVLVGEALVRAADRRAAVRSLLGTPRGTRSEGTASCG